MEEQRISVETAKIAKEKGFDWETNYYYDTAGDLCSEIRKVNWNQSKEKIYSNPNQSLLQKWLREKHGLILWVEFHETSVLNIKWSFDIHGGPKQFIGNSYEECLEAGLVKALNLLK